MVVGIKWWRTMDGQEDAHDNGIHVDGISTDSTLAAKVKVEEGQENVRLEAMRYDDLGADLGAVVQVQEPRPYGQNVIAAGYPFTGQHLQLPAARMSSPLQNSSVRFPGVRPAMLDLIAHHRPVMAPGTSNATASVSVQRRRERPALPPGEFRLQSAFKVTFDIPRGRFARESYSDENSFLQFARTQGQVKIINRGTDGVARTIENIYTRGNNNIVHPALEAPYRNSHHWSIQINETLFELSFYSRRDKESVRVSWLEMLAQ